MLAKLLTLFLSLLALGQGTIDAYVDQMSLGGNLFLVNRSYMISEDYVPEDAQVASAKRLLAALCRNYGFAPSSSTIFGHRDFNATA